MISWKLIGRLSKKRIEILEAKLFVKLCLRSISTVKFRQVSRLLISGNSSNCWQRLKVKSTSSGGFRLSVSHVRRCCKPVREIVAGRFVPRTCTGFAAYGHKNKSRLGYYLFFFFTIVRELVLGPYRCCHIA